MHRDACIVRSSWDVEKNQKMKGGRHANREPWRTGGRKGKMKKSSRKSKKVRIKRDCWRKCWRIHSGRGEGRAGFSVKALNFFWEQEPWPFSYCARPVRYSLCLTRPWLRVLLHQTSKSIKAAIKMNPALQFYVFLLTVLCISHHAEKAVRRQMCQKWKRKHVNMERIINEKCCWFNTTRLLKVVPVSPSSLQEYLGSPPPGSSHICSLSVLTLPQV